MLYHHLHTGWWRGIPVSLKTQRVIRGIVFIKRRWRTRELKPIYMWMKCKIDVICSEADWPIFSWFVSPKFKVEWAVFVLVHGKFRVQISTQRRIDVSDSCFRSCPQLFQGYSGITRPIWNQATNSVLHIPYSLSFAYHSLNRCFLNLFFSKQFDL